MKISSLQSYICLTTHILSLAVQKIILIKVSGGQTKVVRLKYTKNNIIWYFNYTVHFLTNACHTQLKYLSVRFVVEANHTRTCTIRGSYGIEVFILIPAIKKKELHYCSYILCYKALIAWCHDVRHMLYDPKHCEQWIASIIYELTKGIRNKVKIHVNKWKNMKQLEKLTIRKIFQESGGAGHLNMWNDIIY